MKFERFATGLETCKENLTSLSMSHDEGNFGLCQGRAAFPYSSRTSIPTSTFGP